MSFRRYNWLKAVRPSADHAGELDRQLVEGRPVATATLVEVLGHQGWSRRAMRGALKHLLDGKRLWLDDATATLVKGGRKGLEVERSPRWFAALVQPVSPPVSPGHMAEISERLGINLSSSALSQAMSRSPLHYKVGELYRRVPVKSFEGDPA